VGGLPILRKTPEPGGPGFYATVYFLRWIVFTTLKSPACPVVVVENIVWIFCQDLSG
jgi:hypothetical protein